MAPLIVWTKRKWNWFWKNHFLATYYFCFFVLSTIPTIIVGLGFSLPSTLALIYKGIVLVALFAGLFAFALKKRTCPPLPPLFLCAFGALTYILYFYVLPANITFITPDFSRTPNTLVTVNLPFSQRLNTFASVAMMAAFVYVFVFYWPHFRFRSTDIIAIATPYLIYIGIAAAYAAITQWRGVIGLSAGMASYYLNKNTFGLFLLLGVWLSSYSYQHTRRIYFLIGLIGCLIFCMASLSYTSALLAIGFLAAKGIIRFHRTTKVRHKYKAFIAFLVFLVLAFIALMPTIPVLQNTVFGKLVGSMWKKIFGFGDGFYYVFSMRGAYWMFGIYNYRWPYLFMGYGLDMLENMTYGAFLTYLPTSVLTSAYLTIINAYGLIVFALFVWLLVMLFRTIRYTNNRKEARWFLGLLIIYLFYGAFESTLLFDSFSGSLLFTPILIAPIMTMRMHETRFPKRIRLRKDRYFI